LHSLSTRADALAGWLRETPRAMLPLRVALAGASFHARVWLGSAACKALSARPPARDQPAWLRALPLPADVVVARTSLARAQLRRLRAGDVVLPERCTLEPDSGGWRGTAELSVHGSASTVRCVVDGRELTILRHQHLTASHCTPTEGARMSETEERPDRAEPGVALGDDTPIELELCVARFRLSLGELSALAPGQVLDTGQPVGQHAVLRAAGRPVAEGELVEVEGAIGLRIRTLGDA
jgi:type III secretion protein Q